METKEQRSARMKKEYAEGRRKSPFTKGHTFWNNLNSIKTQFIKGHKPPHAGKKSEKMSLSKTGKNNPNWRGGTTDNYTLLKRSPQWIKWRHDVFERDNYTCRDCGIRSGNGKTIILHPHHICERSKFSEKMFLIENGRTLCKDCHKKTIGKEKTYREGLFANLPNSAKLPMPEMVMDNTELNELFNNSKCVTTIEETRKG